MNNFKDIREVYGITDLDHDGRLDLLDLLTTLQEELVQLIRDYNSIYYIEEILNEYYKTYAVARKSDITDLQARYFLSALLDDVCGIVGSYDDAGKVADTLEKLDLYDFYQS